MKNEPGQTFKKKLNNQGRERLSCNNWKSAKIKKLVKCLNIKWYKILIYEKKIIQPSVMFEQIAVKHVQLNERTHFKISSGTQ